MAWAKSAEGFMWSSIQKYEVPHGKSEPLSDERRKEILALLCGEYDYQGMRYDVVMNSKLSSALSPL